jgi:hypothetical protein
VKPKLHILAIGINKYVDRGGKAPATGQTLLFPPLTGSVPDAEAFTAEMKKAAKSSGHWGSGPRLLGHSLLIARRVAFCLQLYLGQ